MGTSRTTRIYRPNVLSLSRHVPSRSGSATRSVAQNEARKRRASERPRVGCCEELGGGPYACSTDSCCDIVRDGLLVVDRRCAIGATARIPHATHLESVRSRSGRTP